MKHPFLAVAIFIFGAFLSWSPAAAQVVDLSPADVTEIQGAVQSQIEALANDDADSAFELTTAETKSRLGTPERFLALIKEQYDPVYRNRLVMMATPKMVAGSVYQLVRLTALDSQVWLAIYQMDKDPDGSWKIDGCELIETTLVSV